MNILKTIALTTAFFSTASFAVQDAFSGHRIGAGFSSAQIDYVYTDGHSADLGSGLKLEYGYDLNRIFGFNVSMDYVTDDYKLLNYDYESKVTTIKLDSDIGYTFDLDGFNLKPYGAIGLARIIDKQTVSDSQGSYTISRNDTSILMGAGVRANFDFGLYSDLRFNFMMLDDYDIDQLSITFGYKF
ncbi:outer membrane beta-barrel protein [Vibrio sp. D404a]|uniref:porin family protein n=1 Tax=unclassified Vibrio TaxID=2614977 RepID=UPI0025536427|nr:MULTISPECIES: porin family protein [unclassified Vibrio]MDK9736207.1 outer membrane beta-barrel protein [Vibrio sp. D404a]MDK9797296.1 outer membrane beta-barrel protein [Vibrio sp. D449a]